MSHFLLVLSFVIGAVLGCLLTVQYGGWSKWRASSTGHVLLSLFAVTAVGYLMSVGALVWPGPFHTPTAEVLRAVVRFAIDGVLLGLYVLLLRAQRRDREKRSAEKE